MRAPLWTIALLLCATSCRERVEPPPPPRDKLPPRRVIDPPGTVRPLPPYAISNASVGPYQLGASLANVLYELPSGPRMALLDVPGLIKQNVIRAEDDGVLVSGAVLGDATLIAVVTREVARTESGIAVGSPRVDVERELGVAGDAASARDPRLLAPQRMPSARLVMQDDRVEAFLLKAGAELLLPPPGEGAPGAAPSPASATSSSAASSQTSEPSAPSGPAAPSGKLAPSSKSKAGQKLGKEAREAKAARDAKAAASLRCPPARTSETESGAWAPACMSPAGEIVRVRGEEVSVRSGADGKERLLAQLRVRGLVFAAPLRSGERPEDRDELVVVSRGLAPEERTWTVALYHLEAGRLVRVAEQVVYRLSAEGARWIGVSLDEVELYLELTAREDVLAVGGYLLAKVAGQIRDVVALREVDVSRRRGGSSGAELPSGAAAGIDGQEPAPSASSVDAGAVIDAAPPSPDAAL